jgi:hypothetical protein
MSCVCVDTHERIKRATKKGHATRAFEAGGQQATIADVVLIERMQPATRGDHGREVQMGSLLQ